MDFIVKFIFDGRALSETVTSSTPRAARAVIEARYPGCQVIAVSK